MAITVDALDKELLLKIYQHDYYSPRFLDERKRLDRLTELGFVWREEPPYAQHEQPLSLPPPRYRLTEQGQRELGPER